MENVKLLVMERNHMKKSNKEIKPLSGGIYGMKIILLPGKTNAGKTATIWLTYENLIGQGASVIMEKKPLGKNPMDFESILSFRGKSIAFYSMGDFYWKCRGAIKEFAKCDYLILAYSDKFKWNLKDAIAKDPKNSVITKTSNNTNDAQALIAAIK